MFRTIKKEKQPGVRLDKTEYRGKEIPGILIAGFFSFLALALLGMSNLLIFESNFTADGTSDTYLLPILLTAFCMTLIYSYRKVTWRTHLAVAAGALAAGIFWREPIRIGAYRVINAGIYKTNEYFGWTMQALEAPNLNNEDNHVFLLTFFMLLVWWMAVSLLQLRRIVAVVIPPFLLICLNLLIGKAPDTAAAITLFTGLIVAVALCDKKRIQIGAGRDRLLILTVLVLVLGFVASIAVVGIFGRSRAEQLTDLHEEMLASQHKLESRIINNDFFSGWNIREGSVSNLAPAYEDKDVMTITIGGTYPQDNVYMRGYVGDTYQNGTWTNTSKGDFSKVASGWDGEYADTAGWNILNMLYPSQDIYRKNYFANSTSTTYTIQYLDVDTDYAYLPYYVNLDSLQELNPDINGWKVIGDGSITLKNKDSIQIEGLSDNTAYFNIPGSIEDENMIVLQENYKEYLDRYLSVPAGLRQISALGDELNQQLEEDYGFFLNNRADYPAEGIATREELAVYLVYQAIAKRTSYSLRLNEVPQGEDVTQYFLFGSGRGFCQQYASAGVLLLRKMGVPARYVTGYYAQAGNFVKGENDDYTATIKDKNAHAWVEYYVDGVGWVPADMTEGSGNRLATMSVIADEEMKFLYVAYGTKYNLLVEQSMDYSQEDLEFIQALCQNAKNQQVIDAMASGGEQESNASGTISGSSKEPAADEKKEQTAQAKEPEHTDGGKDSAEAGTAKNPGANGAATIVLSSNGSFGRRDILIVMGLIITAAIFIYLCISLCHRRAWLEIHQRNKRKAIKCISYYTYRQLRKKGMVKGSHLSDQEYYAILKEKLVIATEAEIRRFYELSLSASYGKDAFEKEDVSFCQNFYERIKAMK